jgi:hypothetical protein
MIAPCCIIKFNIYLNEKKIFFPIRGFNSFYVCDNLKCFLLTTLLQGCNSSSMQLHN